MLTSGKGGVLYVVDRDNLTHYNPGGDQNIQSIALGKANFSAPVYFNGRVYISPVSTNIQAYPADQWPPRCRHRPPSRRRSTTAAAARSRSRPMAATMASCGPSRATTMPPARSMRERRGESRQRVVQLGLSWSPRCAGSLDEVHSAAGRQRKGLRRRGQPTGRLRAPAMTKSRSRAFGSTGRPTPDPENARTAQRGACRRDGPAVGRRRRT